MEFTIYKGTLPDGREKIGVDSSYPNRIKGQKITDGQILEVHTDIYEVSRREIELQKEYGFEVDCIPYFKVYLSAQNAERNAKISATKKGIPKSEETKAKISAAKKGIPKSEETKAKISAAKKGIPKSEETKAKIGAAHKGKRRSEKTKAKISAAHKGKEISQEHRAKISAAKKGIPLSEETKAKMSAVQKGIPKPTIQCPHCERVMSTSHIKRHIKAKHE